MSKIAKNNSINNIFIKDIGLTIAALSNYTIPPMDYGLWSASDNVDNYIDSGDLVINDGYDDLKPAFGKYHIHNEGTHRETMLTAATSTWIVSPVTVNLTKNSMPVHIFTGEFSGQNVNMGDATTYNIGKRFEIFNRSLYPLSILSFGGAAFYALPADKSAVFTLKDNSTQNGEWMVITNGIADITILNPDFTGTKVAFEDFVFDAYAGHGANDNQYAFTAVANSGSSNIDGAVSVVGNDYEGIHILDSLTSSISRPLVSAFNNVNRIKLGSQDYFVEIRVRIETLATIAQKFTTRYGLMDVSTAGLPANGVIFSYDPIYPVTPVAQIVTVTPTNLLQIARQIFTQTINGINYTWDRKVYDIDTLTPNSLPQATYQVVNISNWTRANNTLYTVTINGFICSYTSDANATDAEIAVGLRNAINNNVNINTKVVATGNGKPIAITSLLLGTAFTYTSSANVTLALVTANVEIAIYTVTIGSRPTYSFTSDGTPTASEVVSGLISLINADSLCEMTASGTTVLTLTAKDIGVEITVTQSSNLAFSETTTAPTASEVVTELKNLINADGPLPVTATGTTTLVLTADVSGIPFTYSGTSNLTQVLTQANVAEVLYKGTWIATLINNSSATNFDTNIPVVAGQWYRLGFVVNKTGTQIFIYVDNVYKGSIDMNVTTAALRYIFKLEKTVGTLSRTTSIDSIIWRRVRG